ncbi:MAG: M14 family zinc carboxypeptidase [Candidatus Thermoplasmatota archaeon]
MRAYRAILSVVAILLLLTALLGVGFAGFNATSNFSTGKLPKATLYTYHNYTTLVSDMQNLNGTYPEIFELFTAQELFGLPNVTYDAENYKTWIIRITNESSGFNKSEVLFIGGHHGDETVSVEAAYYLAELLCTNYSTNSWVKYLVDNREIYIMPCANPYGWAHLQRYDEHGYDMNRDYPFDWNASATGAGPTPLSTIGAKAIHELTKRHLFINTVSWHGGAEGIYYAWGCYAHNTAPYECPDDVAFYNQGKYMSQYGGNYSASGPSYYEYGRANDILYPCYGAYEDYAYAASWDLANENASFPTDGCRSLTHCIEISSTKNPAESTLGGRADVFTPGGAEDGYVPKNIRIALLLTDVAEPYINITSDILAEAAPEQKITFKWKVMGALNTTETNIQWGNDTNPINNYTNTTANLSGGTGWQGVEYSQTIKMPSEVGDYYFVIRAKVDNNTLKQSTPDPPDTKPQSLYVNMRTNGSWNITNYENSMQGKVNWYSKIIHIKVRIPDNDVGVSTLSLKDNETYQLGERQINATIKNYGINQQSNFNVSCKIEEIVEQAQVVTVFNDGFEVDLTKWTVSPLNKWLRSTDYANSGSYSVKSLYDNNNTDYNLTSQQIDLTNATSANLEYYFRGSSENNYDYLYVEIKRTTETTWTVLTQYTGETYNSSWNEGSFDVSSYVDSTVQIRFRFHTDSSILNGIGWYVDDVAIFKTTPEIAQLVLNDTQIISEILVQNATKNLTWNHNFQNATDYRITVRTMLADQNPTNDEITVIIRIAFIQNLKTGWNFITLALNSSYTAETLAQNITTCSFVAKWNSSSQKFDIYKRGSLTNDFKLELGIGYLVYVSENDSFNLQGKSIANTTIYLSAGWNSIGWFNNTTIYASSLAKKIGENCTAVAYWDTTVGRFVTYSVGTNLSNFEIKQGIGYFVYVVGATVWKNE